VLVEERSAYDTYTSIYLLCLPRHINCPYHFTETVTPKIKAIITSPPSLQNKGHCFTPGPQVALLILKHFFIQRVIIRDLFDKQKR
jgi:hypothetical protein